MALRCVGANQAMSRAQGIPTHHYIVAGIAMAGGFSAFGGAMMAQHQAYADVNMGVGVLIVGLAATILGETLVGRSTLIRQLAAPVIGSLAYFQVVAVALALGLKPSDLKLLTGLFVLITLAVPIALRAGARPRPPQAGRAPGRAPRPRREPRTAPAEVKVRRAGRRPVGPRGRAPEIPARAEGGRRLPARAGAAGRRRMTAREVRRTRPRRPPPGANRRLRPV